MDIIDLAGVPDESRRRGQVFNRAGGTSFDVRAAAGEGAAEIELYDEIGFWGVTAKDFNAQLREVGPGDLKVKINSPGGDVFDGIAIFNDLVGHQGRVRVEVTGMAASAASIVAMAGDEIVMAENAFMMVHNAWSMVVGNRHDLRDWAGVLDKIDGALAKTYATRSGMGVRTAAKLMDDETWLTAAEAKEKGLADEIAGKIEAKAAFDLSVFAHAPAGLSSPPEAFRASTIRDLERQVMRDARYSRSDARALFAALRQSPAPATTQDAGVPTADIFRAFDDMARRINPNL